MTDETRVIVLLVWGGGTVAMYGIVFLDRLRSWRAHHDRRSMRELLTSLGLFLTALAAGLSIALVLYSPAGSDLRHFFSAVSLGSFAAVGALMVGDILVERRDP